MDSMACVACGIGVVRRGMAWHGTVQARGGNREGHDLTAVDGGRKIIGGGGGGRLRLETKGPTRKKREVPWYIVIVVF